MEQSKEQMMYDIQWLDMNYDRYYFIPWPDSQYYDNVGEDADIVRVENGIFVSCAWIAGGETDF